jgi:hypothetical protein
VGRKRRRWAEKDQSPRSIPGGGKGRRDGECEFCRREGAEWWTLRNTPRVVTLESGAEVLLRFGGGRRARVARKGRRVGWG